MTFSPPNTIAPFLPINQTFSEDDSQFLIQITKFYADIARTTNIRQIGIYDLNENVTGQQFPGSTPQTKKQTFRIVVLTGAMTAGNTYNIPHGIVAVTTFTHIYGVGITTTAGTGGFVQVPLPYVATASIATCIQLQADPTNVTIVMGAAAPNISSGQVILEYLKN